MRTKVESFFIFLQELSNERKIKELRPKMTKIASRGPAFNPFACALSTIRSDVDERVAEERLA